MKDLVTAINDLSKFPEKVVRGTLLDMTSKIIKLSPVKTGRFRGNWNASVNSPDMSTKVVSNSGFALSKAINVTSTMQMGQTFYLTNNLPYAMRLEYGYSAQAPNGMVRITAAEFQSEINKAAAKL